MSAPSWTDQQCATFLQMRKEGVILRLIGEPFGLKPQSVATRLKLYEARLAKEEQGVGQDIPDVDYWGRKTFETWADRKARLARDRSRGAPA